MIDFDGFDWDDGNWPKCGKHGVAQEEIEKLFRAPSLRVEPAPAGHAGEHRWVAIGMGPHTNRWILVIFTTRGPEPKLRPLSARFMHQHEVLRYVRG